MRDRCRGAPATPPPDPIPSSRQASPMYHRSQRLSTLGAGIVVALGIGTLTPHPVEANEFCVVCEEPQAIYRCASLTTGPAAQRSLAGLACTQHIAANLGHARCAVRLREAACDAPLVVLPGADILPAAPLADGSQPPPTDTAVAVPQAPAREAWTTNVPVGSDGQGEGNRLGEAPAPQEGGASEPAPPGTLVEATKRAWEQSGAAIEKAGETINDTGRSIGNAAGGAWRCLTSLFSDCE